MAVHCRCQLGSLVVVDNTFVNPRKGAIVSTMARQCGRKCSANVRGAGGDEVDQTRLVTAQHGDWGREPLSL